MLPIRGTNNFQHTSDQADGQILFPKKEHLSSPLACNTTKPNGLSFCVSSVVSITPSNNERKNGDSIPKSVEKSLQRAANSITNKRQERSILLLVEKIKLDCQNNTIVSDPTICELLQALFLYGRHKNKRTECALVTFIDLQLRSSSSPRSSIFKQYHDYLLFSRQLGVYAQQIEKAHFRKSCYASKFIQNLRQTKIQHAKGLRICIYGELTSFLHKLLTSLPDIEAKDIAFVVQCVDLILMCTQKLDAKEQKIFAIVEKETQQAYHKTISILNISGLFPTKMHIDLADTHHLKTIAFQKKTALFPSRCHSLKNILKMYFLSQIMIKTSNQLEKTHWFARHADIRNLAEKKINACSEDEQQLSLYQLL